ncbi:uncharacterized protein (DUF1697 family) [Granulicella aggregans]|uniref:Uncharacterized protein (DUF1697 family) n=1 Tax=Granulicella aggregans TaxID=474949 RepID=A0A7W8E452_9BACT|nr:DUF1697 domain-containing protein [Granulicella aggregans]MBB5058141.1 uncharacterized protein (DUF1697 family) [Granulicella aggregans]
MSHPPAVALLRGINVGGKNILPMKSLTELFHQAGAEDIKTYIQSGNVVFRAAHPDKIATKVRAKILTDFSFKVPVITRSAAELATTVAANPFLQSGIDPSLLHVMFLADQSSPELIAKLDPSHSSPDEFALIGRDLYLHLPNGAARTKLTTAYFDATLKTTGTQRNWRTVLTLATMLGLPPAQQNS